MGQCPEKSSSPCNTCHTCVIIQMYVLICHKKAHTHTHTHSIHITTDQNNRIQLSCVMNSVIKQICMNVYIRQTFWLKILSAINKYDLSLLIEKLIDLRLVLFFLDILDLNTMIHQICYLCLHFLFINVFSAELI